ncbi:conserved protein of unknown function (plasmid) [Pararobbsia alpina]
MRQGRRVAMRKEDLLTWLSDMDSPSNQVEPPERAVFLLDKEIEQCSLILNRLMSSSRQAASARTSARAVPLPNIDLPLVF